MTNRIAATDDPPSVEVKQERCEGSLIPILLEGFGRSGSTLLMQLLATSPEIAFDRVYPFENRYLTYMLCWTKLFQEPYKPTQDLDSNVIEFESALVLPSPPPFQNRHLIKTDETTDDAFWRRCFCAVWLEFSSYVRQKAPSNGSNHFEVRYYAEKTPWWVSSEVGKIMPAKTLYRLRDPRDIWISVLAFDGKRGFPGFGRKVGENEKHFFDRFIQAQKQYFVKLNEVVASRARIIVRYENLVTDLQGEADRLSEWLGVSLSADVVMQQTEQFEHHMTSLTLKDSVQRWKRELDPEINEKFIQHLGKDLERYGYELWPEPLSAHRFARKKSRGGKKGLRKFSLSSTVRGLLRRSL